MNDQIRPARAEEAAMLSEMALRSKGYWGYDANFLEACRDELTVHAEAFARKPTWVIERDGTVCGFYVLSPLSKTLLELDLLYIDPKAVGKGLGKRLMDHALDWSRQHNFKTMEITADPNAVGFYEAMGANRIGTMPSGSIPGRSLPHMSIGL